MMEHPRSPLQGSTSQGHLAALVGAGLLVLACGSGTGPTSGRAGPDHAKCSALSPAACETKCEGGDDAACETLTLSYLRWNTDAGRQKASALSQKLCDTGREAFCNAYAMALATGSGVKPDRERARMLFEAHCHRDPKACSEYGSLFAAGRGVEQDLGLAHLLLGEACDHEDALACEELTPLLEHTCSGGHGGGCSELAIRKSAGGEGPSAVVPLFERACDLNDATGCLNLARAYGEGYGVTPDAERAARLVSKACELDSTRCPGGQG